MKLKIPAMNFPGRFILFILLFLTLIPTRLKSQVVVTQGTDIGLTPQEFVETYLVGTGITVSNAKYNGSTEPLNSPLRTPPKYRDQIGSFTSDNGAQTQLGIAGGVLLSTGYTAEAIAGSVPDENMWGFPGAPPEESDPDLAILSGTTIHDKSILEFDFVPQTDVVTFRYVFGSIEFDEFCSSINDAFGLFLSGYGITGGFGFENDAVNIALLPNSANYVTIFNICDADAGNHENGVYSWWNSKKDYLSYDRLTYVFTASYSVTCNETYHMKFAIGDASDAILDSGVFLEQNSFSSNNVVCAPTFSNPLTGELLVEGYNSVSLVYSIAQAKQVDLNIDLVIHPSGTADQDDITPNPFPVTATIPAGQLQSAPILIDVVMDGIPEGTETLVIKGTPPIICGISNSVMNEFTIKEYFPMVIDLPDATICGGSTALLSPVITGGQPILPSNSFNYLWSTSATTATITVSPPPGHHVYSVTVTDALNQTAIAQTTVDVGAIPEAAGPIAGTPDICAPVTGYTYYLDPIPGADTYIWTLPAGITVTAGANTNSITVDIGYGTSSGNISVFGRSTYCGDGAPATLPLTINPSPEPAGAISGTSPLCQGPLLQNFAITPLPHATSYEWAVPPGVSIQSGSGSSSISCLITNAAVSGNITVRGYNDLCLYGTPSTFPLIVDPLPGDAGSITSISGAEVCRYQNGVLYSIPPVPFAASYNWEYSGTGITMTNNGTDLLIDFSATATSGILTVKGQNLCGSGLPSQAFNILVKPKPTAGLTICNAIETTKNGRPIVLKGGSPIGNGGEFIGTGVSEPSPGVYIFDPTDNSVTGGSATTGIEHPVTYRYTNTYNCYDEESITITVFASNANDPCPGSVKDHRDGKIYKTFSTGSGVNARCWMAENLNYGEYADDQVIQTDNCLVEKYCKENNAAQCASSGGFYQWSEIVEYQENAGYQDLCPPGWHLATDAEWEQLIGANLGVGLAGIYLQDIMIPNSFSSIPEGIFYLNTQWAFTTGTAAGTMYWTSDGLPGNRAMARGMNAVNPSVSVYPAARSNAFPARCVRN